MNTRKVLAAVPLTAERAGPYVERLEQAGFEVTVNRNGRVYSEAEMVQLIPDYFATIASIEPYNDKVLNAAQQLKVIARMDIGHDQIDVAAATRHGVAVAVAVAVVMACGSQHEPVADAGSDHGAMDALLHRAIDSIIAIGNGQDADADYVINPEVLRCH